MRLCGWSANGGAGTTDTPVSGTAAAPGAGANVATVSLGNGTYTVEWTLELTGTPGAADVDNVQALIGATPVAFSSNLGAVGVYQQEEFGITVTGGTLVLSFRAIGAAAAGSNYKIIATVIPTSGATATVFDGGQPIAYMNVTADGNDTNWLDDYGIAVLTELSVLATSGTVSGVLWYRMVYDDDPPSHDSAYG